MPILLTILDNLLREHIGQCLAKWPTLRIFRPALRHHLPMRIFYRLIAHWTFRSNARYDVFQQYLYILLDVVVGYRAREDLNGNVSFSLSMTRRVSRKDYVNTSYAMEPNEYTSVWRVRRCGASKLKA